jgi:hypothetical protein
LLYDRPLDNFRKHCIWRIFVPYFINVKGLSRKGGNCYPLKTLGEMVRA